ncbi:MAG: tyrosine-type recombinase/integrase [Myxococcota bacterium]|nr:tyrosine-type recombinase/integrase [Myxococcota bacterium]
MPADLRPPSQADSSESADFCLTPEEIEKGRTALTRYLETTKAGDPRSLAVEALDVLAAVMSDGRCTARTFPWQQVRGYHAALSLSIIKKPGAPSRVEGLLCRHDDTRKFQQVPERYSVKQIHKMNSGLTRIIEECRNVGFLDDEEFELAQHRGKEKNKRKPGLERRISEGEVRALIAASAMDTSVRGPRDALMIGLAYSGGLRTIDLVNLNLDDLHFDGKSGKVTVRFRVPGAKRARRVPLRNDQLISLEDWLAARNRESGPLFCPIGRAGAIERKRMSAAEMRELCDKRADRAGVLPFAPNDLARSGLLARTPAKRRSGQSATPVARVSPLYEDESQDSGNPEQRAARIHFPYRARPGL